MTKIAGHLSTGENSGDRELIKELRHALKLAEERTARLERELGVLSKVGTRTTPPRWLTSPPKRGRHNATPFLMLSDLHLDEVVDPDEVGGVNKYDREIARLRLGETARKFVKICRDYWTGVDYDGAIVALGGDIFSGDIHDELTQTNEDTMLGSLDYWIDEMAAALALIVDEFGKVHVPVVVGNHGRTTRKPRSKLRARDNFDWFLGRALARMFRDDPRITFDVSDSADCPIQVYSHTVMLTHGDQASGGAGIGGIWPPIMRLDARKRQRYEAVGQGYDMLIMGHWHQLVYGKNFIVNGSLKGMDEYAAINNFGYEPPAQAAWLMTPEHGRTWTAPILPMNRDAEGW